MYSGIFSLEIPENTIFVGFLEDVAILVTVHHLEKVQTYADKKNYWKLVDNYEPTQSTKQNQSLYAEQGKA